MANWSWEDNPVTNTARRGYNTVTNPRQALDPSDPYNTFKNVNSLVNPIEQVGIQTGEDALGALKDVFNPEMPQPTNVPLDEQTRGLIDTVSEQGRKDPAQLQAEHMAGVNNAIGGLMPRQENSLGGEGGAFSQAIANKTQGLANEKLSALTEQSHQKALQNKFKNVQRAFTTRLNAENVYTDALRRQMQADTQQEAARAQVISSVVGGVGYGAGIYAGLAGGKNKAQAPSPRGNEAVSLNATNDDIFNQA